MTKDEFIGKFSDKDKIEIAEKCLGMMYDQMISNDYCQVVNKCDYDAQVLRNAINDITGATPIRILL